MKVKSSVEIKVLGGEIIATHTFPDEGICKLIIEHERFEPFSTEIASDEKCEKIEVLHS